MPKNGRRRGRGRGGGDGSWAWAAVGSALQSAGQGSRRGRGRGTSRGAGGGSRDPFVGHDTARHHVRSDTHLKPRRGGRARGKGGGDRKEERRNDICFDFSKTGSCPRGNSCRFLHIVAQPVTVEEVLDDAIGRHCEVVGAHGGSILAITMSEQGIYTGSADKSLKRWKPVRKDDGRMELVQDLLIPLSDSCHSMLFAGGWLFVGLWDGNVRAYNQDGTDCTLQGHSKRVTTLLVHQAVLISGSADREVRLWQMNGQTKSWSCTHTIRESMPGAINRLHVLGENLFVGGMNGLAICNLVSLTVTKILPPTKSVADLLEFEHHLIVAYADGGLRIFDAEGTLKKEVPSLKAGPILSLGGLESGPRVLVGHTRGQVTTIMLPSFEFKTQFQAMDSTRVESIKCAGHDGIFLLGAHNGTLQLWQRLGS